MKMHLSSRPALLLLLLALALPLAAQENAAPQAHPPETPHQPSEERAHAEAADPHAQFKQSASVQWLARLTGLPAKWAFWVAMIFNFVIIASVIGYFLRKYLPGVFRRRTESIQREMREAEQASAEAQRRLSEIEARLARLDVEIAEMRSTAESEAAAEEARVRAAAEEDKARIVTAAQQEVALAARVARRELQAHAAELAVSLAAKGMQIDPATDQALVRHFTGQLNTEGNGGPAPAAPGKDRESS